MEQSNGFLPTCIGERIARSLPRKSIGQHCTCSLQNSAQLAACTEERKALQSLDMCSLIDEATVDKLGVTPVPTMNVLTIKSDAQGIPFQAKSHTVVHGNEVHLSSKKGAGGRQK